MLSEWVLTEFLASAAKPFARRRAAEFVSRLAASEQYLILEANHNNWQEGFNLYQSRTDKAWSLVDCISIVQCQRLKVRDVFSADRHFEQAGLICLLPASPA